MSVICPYGILDFSNYLEKPVSSLSPRILFQPEYTTSTQNGVTRAAVAMLGDITFEEAVGPLLYYVSTTVPHRCKG